MSSEDIKNLYLYIYDHPNNIGFIIHLLWFIPWFKVMLMLKKAVFKIHENEVIWFASLGLSILLFDVGPISDFIILSPFSTLFFYQIFSFTWYVSGLNWTFVDASRVPARR